MNENIYMKKFFFNGFFIKIKINKNIFNDQFIFLRKLEKMYPLSIIKIDANGCFKNFDDFYFFLKKFSVLKNIYYIEQPIPSGNWIEMKKICRRSTIPIALDEELRLVSSLYIKKKMLDIIKPNFLVIKPGENGGFYGSEEWISEANKRNINWCISSSLESNIGMNIISQWTFIMEKKYGKKNFFYIHGLKTENVYKKNFPSFFISGKNFIKYKYLKKWSRRKIFNFLSKIK